MSRHILLERYALEEARFGLHRSWRVRIVAADHVNQPDFSVFVWKRLPADAEGNVFDVYTGIASAHEMYAFPPTAPPEDGSTIYFRLPFGDMMLPSVLEGQQFWEETKERVDRLLFSLDAFDGLQLREDYWAGGTPEGGDSESASNSTSESASASASDSTSDSQSQSDSAS